MYTWYWCTTGTLYGEKTGLQKRTRQKQGAAQLKLNAHTGQIFGVEFISKIIKKRAMKKVSKKKPNYIVHKSVLYIHKYTGIHT